MCEALDFACLGARHQIPLPGFSTYTCHAPLPRRWPKRIFLTLSLRGPSFLFSPLNFHVVFQVVSNRFPVRITWLTLVFLLRAVLSALFNTFIFLFFCGCF